MIKVYVRKQSNYPVNSGSLKKRLREFLEEKGIVSDSQVSVFLVGEKKMLALTKKHGSDNGIHSVLSFVENETKKAFIYPPGDLLRLGEIYICYSQAVEEAKREAKLIEEKIYELVEHGARHLLGEHHE
jgi:rRNA maturation RNase YbeY